MIERTVRVVATVCANAAVSLKPGASMDRGGWTADYASWGASSSGSWQQSSWSAASWREHRAHEARGGYD